MLIDIFSYRINIFLERQVLFPMLGFKIKRIQIGSCFRRWTIWTIGSYNFAWIIGERVTFPSRILKHILYINIQAIHAAARWMQSSEWLWGCVFRLASRVINYVKSHDISFCLRVLAYRRYMTRGLQTD